MQYAKVVIFFGKASLFGRKMPPFFLQPPHEASLLLLPIITTNKCIAGLALLKGDYSIIPINDATTLHNNIVHLINSPEEQKEMSTQNLQTIHQYTMAHTIFQILNQ